MDWLVRDGVVGKITDCQPWDSVLNPQPAWGLNFGQTSLATPTMANDPKLLVLSDIPLGDLTECTLCSKRVPLVFCSVTYLTSYSKKNYLLERDSCIRR